MIDLSELTAACTVVNGKLRVAGHEEWRRLLGGRPDCGLACALRAYAYGPALDAEESVLSGTGGGLTAAQLVSLRVIERLRTLGESSYGPCPNCSTGKNHALLMRDLALDHCSVLMACDYCAWRGPISFVAPQIIEHWIESLRAPAPLPTDAPLPAPAPLPTPSEETQP